MPVIPPRRGSYTVRDPHGSEAAAETKWEGAAAWKEDVRSDGSSQQRRPGKVEEGPAGKSVDGRDTELEAEQKGDIIEEVTANKVVVEVTEEKEVVAVMECDVVFAGGEVVEIEETEMEAYVVQRAPMVSGSGETVANTVAAPRDTESRIQKGPACIPPGDS